MDSRAHWDTVYGSKDPKSVSWYAPHLEQSIKIIDNLCTDHCAALIDVGAGESTLVEDLLLRGYRDLTVLDISAKAIEDTKLRMGTKATSINWMIADITKTVLPDRRFDIWHDRAVFHFLTAPEDRSAYVKQVLKSVKPGGHVIVATFGTEGPEKCSGLEVMRYDAQSLHAQFGKTFQLVSSQTEDHKTPFGTTQQFLYCYCKVEESTFF